MSGYTLGRRPIAVRERDDRRKRLRFVREHFRELGAIMRGEMVSMEAPVGQFFKNRRHRHPTYQRAG